MKNISYSLLAICIFIISCDPGIGKEQTREQAIKLNNTIKKGNAAKDARFLVNVYTYNLMLQEYGNIIKWKESAPIAVKNFAIESTRLAEQLNNELAKIGAEANIALPNKLNEEQQDVKEELDELEGEELANEYIKTVENIKQKIIASTSEATRYAGNNKIRSWIKRTLPKFKERADKLNELKKNQL